MKRALWLCLVLVLLSGCTVGARAETDMALLWPEAPVTLYVSSDLHWQEPGREGADALIKQMAYMEEIVDTLIDETLRAKPAALILCGDLTNGGSAEEHGAVAEKLELLRESGVPVFVTMGNHDLDRGLEPANLKEIYYVFGYENALSEDTDSMSYLAAVSDELWLLSLDCNVYGDKQSTWAGTISETTLDWVKSCLDRAAEAGAMVVPFSHYNLVVHNMNEKGDNYNVDRGDELTELLMNYGVPIYLSGHRHNSFVASVERNGSRLDELVSDMPEAYPHRYTTVTFQPDGLVDYAVPNMDVSGWAARAGRTEPELLDFASYTERLMAKRRQESAEASLRDLDLPADVRADMTDYFVDFYESYQNRRLFEERERLLLSPGYALWQKYASSTVYGRWIPWLLTNQYSDAPRQRLGPYR